MRKIFFFLAFLLSLGQVAFASTIFTSDSSGTQKTTFYTNETIYLAPSATNITTNATSVTIYIVSDSNSWTNQTVLRDASGSGYKNITTNATGFLTAMTVLWASSQKSGNYDIVVDVNSNSLYDTGVDIVFDPSVAGFQIVSLPVPTLTVALGGNTTVNHNYTIPSNNTDNVMMQMKMTAGSFEDVKVNSLSIIANGTGDDAKGMSMIKIILDSNGDGLYNTSETLLGAGKYLRDNGVAQVNFYDGYIIPINGTAYFLIVYTMSNSSSNNDTYSFQLTSVSAVGRSDGVEARTTMGSVSSAMKTISAAAVTTSSTTTSTLETTTSGISTTTTTSSQKWPTYYWIYLAAGVSITVIIFFLVFWLRTSSVAQNEFKPPQ